MKNKKWYSLPRFYSWQYVGLLFGTLYLGWLVVISVGSSLLFNGADFLNYLDWQLLGTALLVFIWTGYVGAIEKDWDDIETISHSSEIENYSDQKMYTKSFGKYLFGKTSLFISWIIILFVGYNWLSDIQGVISQHPERIIISLLVVIAFLVYKKK